MGRYVQKDQEWEGPRTDHAEHPAHDRSAVPLFCYRCGHEWETKAACGNSVPCPSCKHARRVPAGARDPFGRPVIRTREEEAAELFDRANRRRPPTAPAPQRLRRPNTPTPAPNWPPNDDWLGRIAAQFARASAANRAAASPASTTRTPAPRPTTRSTAPAPAYSTPAYSTPAYSTPAAMPDVPATSLLAIGRNAPRLTAAVELAGPIAWHAAGQGTCAMYDSRMQMFCVMAASHRAALDRTAYLPVCEGHAYAIANRAEERGVRIQFTARHGGAARMIPRF